jgi:hypothetical protein
VKDFDAIRQKRACDCFAFVTLQPMPVKVELQFAPFFEVEYWVFLYPRQFTSPSI